MIRGKVLFHCSIQSTLDGLTSLQSLSQGRGELGASKTLLGSGGTDIRGQLGEGSNQCLCPFIVTTTDLQLSGMRTLEHVAVTVTITHPRRGNLEIRLFCPSGMMSLIGTTRSMDS